MKNRRLILILAIATLLLLIPMIAMQFTGEVNWTTGDFVVAAALLYGTGLLCEFVLRKARKTRTRIALCATIVVILLVVWAELAVGIFGTPISGS